MGAIAFENLAGLTLTYGEVQFGGNDAGYKSLPPVYSFRGNFEYDESRRAVVRTHYVVSVNCVFYESNEANMAIAAEALRERLSVSGDTLKIEGLGTGFGTIASGNWGPKPIGFDWRPLGQIAFEVAWVVEFWVNACHDEQHSPGALLAFNFDTTWQNDFEGICQRTISGYAEIDVLLQNGVPIITADSVKDSINIIIPQGFRRDQNVWRVNNSHDRCDFVVVDSALPGDAPPAGISRASGDLAFGSEGPGFAQAQTTLSMNLTVAPNHPRQLGPFVFLSAAITKQNQMQAAIGAGGSVVPAHLSLRMGKYDSAREFSGSMTWILTKCLNNMMMASGVWQPITTGLGDSYTEWRASVQALWGNRGLHGLRAVASEAAVIDLCDNLTRVSIGDTPADYQPPAATINFAFGCPAIPEDGGWLGHDIKLEIMREDKQTWHAKAAAWLNNIPGQGDPATYQPGSNEEPDVEYHGLPDTYILLRFKMLRFIDDRTKVDDRLPIPRLKSIGGFPTTFVREFIEKPEWAFDVLTCPVFSRRGWRLYRIKGWSGSKKVLGSQRSCSTPYNQEDADHQ